MKKIDRWIKTISIISGIAAAGFFLFDGFVFSQWYPNMIRFAPIPSASENWMIWIGIGWLIFLGFTILSLYRIVRNIRLARRITPSSLLMVAMGVLAFIMVFSNVALISDIGKQYKAGFAQPEWTMLFGFSGYQFLVTILFTGYHLLASQSEEPMSRIARDNNIYIVVQYVGIITGLLGLGFSSMGFIYSRGWSPSIHSGITLIILLIPYSMAVLYWFVTKLQEKPRQWYDEKQLLDTGKSAYLTLVLSVLFMAALFVACFKDLAGAISMLWFPLFIFFVLLLFSAGNLYFSGKE